MSKSRQHKKRSKVAPGPGELSQPKEGASQPLIVFLETIKSHDYGTELERVFIRIAKTYYSQYLQISEISHERTRNVRLTSVSV